MVWRAIAYDSRSTLIVMRGTLTGQRYIDDILRPHVGPFLNGLPGAIFQQDNARPHKLEDEDHGRDVDQQASNLGNRLAKEVAVPVEMEESLANSLQYVRRHCPVRIHLLECLEGQEQLRTLASLMYQLLLSYS
ncbi:transposable element Tcb2 transposase [Trichonephila clavipes]|uniref:Transposable element Tcb2 transposase n=1 Tax=Trichonephila clavipes TaxID=2585209 RepID=A0A8X7BBA7_TRICX|nr:transposable element Tcb2 transposase [Trichonephila clavipes]